MNTKSMFLAVIAALLLATGCATSSSQLSQVNTTAGPLQANGDLNAVVKKVTTTVTKDAAGNVVSTTTEVVEEQAARNNADADHDLAMRREDRKEAVGVARAQNPAPVIVVPTRYYSVVTTGQRHRTGSSTHRGGGSRQRTPSRRVSTSAGRNTVGGSKPKPRR
ncbi:MAG: hypothetical protein WAV15_01415 [Minisyncoccia bacterium]